MLSTSSIASPSIVGFSAGRLRKVAAAALLGTTILTGSVGLPANAFAAPQAISHELPGSFADLVERVTPAVVNVSTVQGSADSEQPRGMPGMPEFPPGSPFEEFFKQFQEQQRGARPKQQEKQQAQGSGFIVDAAGYVVTNNHVIDGAEEITVTTHDGAKLDAKLVGRDPKTDLALLKVEAGKPLPYLEFGDSDTARVGDWVIAIGNPFGLGGTVTSGIVSARGRDIQAGPYDDFLQLDASINRGNSGGPTFDVQGRVIGINTAIFSPNGGSVGIGFAIPSNLAKGVIAQLRETGTVSRGWLGVQIQQVTPEIAESLGLTQPKGALVADVTADSPAAKSKVQAGDVILSLDGRPVDTIKDLTRMVADSKTGSDVTLEVLRRGKRQNISVRLDQMPDQPKVAAATPAPESGATASHTVLGMQLSKLSEQSRRKYGLTEGIEGVLVVGTDESLGEVNLRPGDVITEVGSEPVAAPDQIAAKIKEAKEAGRGAVLLRVSRQGTEQFVAVSIKKA
ncbi:serine protease [Skermanella aerolata]|uniref:Probable periplasmic serine endoprotease DegP-like n=1 Tax=Skermanella aerolata TaxID=393310 RepID=A0A512DHB0_9PROT|nr:DegQ family serine endoprotease [Skermanella aerolata]KJB94126.1 serine protease [Skermanella aerolata KACC 11604]GEO35855.1 serine protease [Skermanella aerolata]